MQNQLAQKHIDRIGHCDSKLVKNRVGLGIDRFVRAKLSGVRVGTETAAAAALPLNLDIAFNKEHLTDPAEIARSVALNTALDLGFGAAGEGIGAGVRAYRAGAAARAAETAQKEAASTWADENVRAVKERLALPGPADDPNVIYMGDPPPVPDAYLKAYRAPDYSAEIERARIAARGTLPNDAAARARSSDASTPYRIAKAARTTPPEPVVAKTRPRTIKEQVNAAIPELEKSEALHEVSSADLIKDRSALQQDVIDYYNNIGNSIDRPGFGSVILDKNSFSNSIRYRMTDSKAVTFKSVPEVIQNGIEIAYSVRHKGRPYDTYTFAAKLNIDSKPAYIAVVVRSTVGENRFYVHKVFDTNGKVHVLASKMQVGESSGMDGPASSIIRTNQPATEPPIPAYTPRKPQGVGPQLPSRVVQGDSSGINIQQPGPKVNPESGDIPSATPADDAATRAEKHAVTRQARTDDNYRTFVDDPSYGEPAGSTPVAEFAKMFTGKGVGILKDLARNLDAAAARVPHLRAVLRNTIETPLNKAKGAYSSAVKGKLDFLFNDIVKALDIRKGSAESAAVQWLGEGKRQAFGENGKVISGEFSDYTLQNLKEDFNYTAANGKKAWENIVRAEGMIRRTYNEYVDEINDVLRKIYPNIEDEVARLRSKLADATDPAEIAKLEQAIDDAWIGKRLVPRNDYFRHFTELQRDGFFKTVDTVLNGATNIDPRLVGVSEFTEPKTRYSGFLQHRNLGAYTEDAVGGMLDYIPQAEYKKHIEPMIPLLRSVVKDLKENTINTKNANQLIDYLMKFTNDLAGKTGPVERALQNIRGDENGRRMLNVLGRFSNRVRSGLVVGNLNTMLAQVYNMPNLVALAKNPVDIGAIMAMLGTYHIMNEGLEALTGRRIGFDPIYYLREYMEGEYDDEDHPLRTMGANMLGNVASNVPFGSYFATAAQGVMGLTDLDTRKVFGEEDPSRFGTGGALLEKDREKI
ncbi:MAG: hypothetical protein LBK57_08960 [Clostridiales Family XIII bacterium]|jgi:hypothetical protein|nr:hypothetical protein [Clostridiales Family XIII bacterium]